MQLLFNKKLHWFSLFLLVRLAIGIRITTEYSSAIEAHIGNEVIITAKIEGLPSNTDDYHIGWTLGMAPVRYLGIWGLDKELDTDNYNRSLDRGLCLFRRTN